MVRNVLNLQKQMEENNPIDTWLDQHMVELGNKRIHVHRLEKAYNKGRPPTDKIRLATVTNKLIARGYEVPENKLKDSGCCDTSNKCITVRGLEFLV